MRFILAAEKRVREAVKPAPKASSWPQWKRTVAAALDAALVSAHQLPFQQHLDYYLD